MIKTLKIDGMTCEKCVAHVKSALEAVPGVRTVDVSLEKGEARVEGCCSMCEEGLKKALTDEGFKVGGVCNGSSSCGCSL